MPAFTFTANATTNQLTIASHGLVTGAGPGAVWSRGGTVPGGLAPSTDYWVIRDDDNTLRLATSSANAIAGTAIDLTSTGTGTLSLGLGLPYRRPRTYAEKTQVKSADLNALFDTGIALWSTAHDPRWVWQALQRGITEDHITYDGGDFLHANAPSALYSMQGPPLVVGQRPLTIGARVKGSGGAQTVQVALMMSNGDGTSTELEKIVIVNPPSTWATYTADIDPDVAALVAGKALYWFVNMPLTNTYLSNLGVEFDFPP